MDHSMADLEDADRTVASLRQRLDRQAELVDSLAAEQVATREETTLGMMRMTLAEALVHRAAVARDVRLRDLSGMNAA